MFSSEKKNPRRFKACFSGLPLPAIAIFSAILCSSVLYAQMPGWITIRDKDGNKYFVDQYFKIHVDGEPDAVFKPVAVESLIYLQERSEELIRSRHPVEGLRILKSIRLLSSLNKKAEWAGIKASKAINAFKQKEKDRYIRYDHESALLMVRLGNETVFFNNWMNWTLSHGGSAAVISRKIHEKDGYARDGVSIGLRFDSSAESTYDAILTVNSEELNYRIGFVEKYIELTRNKNPGDTFIRKTISQNGTQTLYSFESAGGEKYAGLELFEIKRNCGYHLVMIFPAANTAKNESSALKIMKSFSVKGSD